MSIVDMRVKFIPMNSDGDLEGLYKSYNVKLGESYPVIGYGEKILIRVGNRIIDVFPSRLEIVD